MTLKVEKETMIRYLQSNRELLEALSNMIMYTNELIKFYNELKTEKEVLGE